MFFIVHCRLKRVQQHQRQEYETKDVGADEPGVLSVCLYEDYAATTADGFIVGNVTRIICVGKRSRLEYRKPVPFSTENAKNLTVTFNVYKQCKDSVGNFRLHHSQVTEVPFNTIICHVNLSVTADGLLHMSAQDLEALNQHTKGPRGSSEQQRQRQTRALCSADDGLVLVPVEPVQAPEGIRRSQRKRRAKVYTD